MDRTQSGQLPGGMELDSSVYVYSEMSQQLNNEIKAKQIANSYPLVLIIEDNTLQQRMYTLIAESAKIKVCIVDNCEKGIELASALDFNLIIMDLRMPDMNGIDCAKAIRNKENEKGGGARVPLIAVTADAMPGQREKCLEAGMDDYLSKPFTLAEFKDKCAKWARTA